MFYNSSSEMQLQCHWPIRNPRATVGILFSVRDRVKFRLKALVLEQHLSRKRQKKEWKGGGNKSKERDGRDGRKHPL